MLQRAAQLGWLHICFLKVGTVRIAVRISLVYRNKLFMLKSGYDEAFHRYSPGQVLTEHLLREAWEKKWDEVDFLGEEERWKLSWATDRIIAVSEFEKRHALGLGIALSRQARSALLTPRCGFVRAFIETSIGRVAS